MALNKEVLLKGCPMNVTRGLSNDFYWRVVQRMLSEVQRMLSEGCPMNVIGGLSNEFYRRLVQDLYRRVVQWVSKGKIFCFENSFHIWQMYVLGSR